MAQERKRFAFDDEDEVVEEEVIKQKPAKEESLSKQPNTKASEDTNINIEEPRDDKSMKKKNKKKKKFKLRVWQMIAILCLLIMAAFITYIFVATNNDGPVYGDRCIALLDIDENRFSDVEQEMLGHDGVQSISISRNCRMIDIVITYDDYVGADDAQTLAVHTLHVLDVALGHEKENASDPYSKVFGFANGRGQFNVNFRLRSAGEQSEFPIFGTKQPQIDEVSFTRASPVDEETTERVRGNSEQRRAEEEIENEEEETEE